MSAIIATMNGTAVNVPLSPIRVLSSEELNLVAGGGFWGDVGSFLGNTVTGFTGVGALMGAFTNSVAATVTGAAIGAAAGAAFVAGYGFGSFLYYDTGFGTWLGDEIDNAVDTVDQLMSGIGGYLGCIDPLMGGLYGGYCSILGS